MDGPFRSFPGFCGLLFAPPVEDIIKSDLCPGGESCKGCPYWVVLPICKGGAALE